MIWQSKNLRKSRYQKLNYIIRAFPDRFNESGQNFRVVKWLRSWSLWTNVGYPMGTWRAFGGVFKPVLRNASTVWIWSLESSFSFSNNSKFSLLFRPLCIEKSCVIFVLQSGWSHISNMCSILFSVFAFYDFEATENYDRNLDNFLQFMSIFRNPDFYLTQAAPTCGEIYLEKITRLMMAPSKSRLRSHQCLLSLLSSPVPKLNLICQPCKFSWKFFWEKHSNIFFYFWGSINNRLLMILLFLFKCLMREFKDSIYEILYTRKQYQTILK